MNASVQLIELEQALKMSLVDKAVAEGKFEIAADVLHDIANAVVGFGSYLTRIRRSMEQSNPDNLVNLAGFLTGKKTEIGSVIGEAKAGAVVNMINSIIVSQQSGREEIQKSIEEQLHLITHIQEMLNIQRQYVSGQGTMETKPVNLRTIITDCLAMLFASMDKRGIAVSMKCTAEIPVIQGDRTRMMQVIMNILKNSIEAVDKNSSVKTLSVRLYKDEAFLFLEVGDNGSGFDEKTAGLLFVRGFTTKTSGTGLGLHNCRAILESHAGTISITSEGPGKGALTVIQFKT